VKYFIDTNICIYFLKGLNENLLLKIKQSEPRQIKIPIIVKAELFYGAEKSKKKVENLEKVKKFLEPYEIVLFDNSCIDIYAKTRAGIEKDGKPVGPNDLIIASIVLANSGILITNNEKEFGNIKSLKIEKWCK